MSSGADWLLGDVGQPKKGKKQLAEVEEYLESEASARLLDPPSAAKALNQAVLTAHEKAVELIRSGLTVEALALLIAEKSPSGANGKRPSPETVKLVLRGMAKLDEWVRK